MAARQHETVAVGPAWLRRIKLQKAGKQHRGDVGHAQRQAGMTGFGGFDRIQAEHPDGIGKMPGLNLIGRGHRGSSARGGWALARGRHPVKGRWHATNA